MPHFKFSRGYYDQFYIPVQVDVSIQKPLLLENPQIVVATPVRALLHLKSSNLSLKKSLDMLVIDEADLMFSLGYENEVKEVLK